MAGPHAAFLDFALISSVTCSYWRCRSLIQSENAKLIISGAIMANHPIQVYRSQKQSKQIVAKQIIELAQSHGAYPQIVIAPEGTVGNRKSFLRFKVVGLTSIKQV